MQREGRGRDECVCSQRKMLNVVDGGPKWWTKMVDPRAKCTKWLAGLRERWVLLLLF